MRADYEIIAWIAEFLIEKKNFFLILGTLVCIAMLISWLAIGSSGRTYILPLGVLFLGLPFHEVFPLGVVRISARETHEYGLLANFWWGIILTGMIIAYNTGIPLIVGHAAMCGFGAAMCASWWANHYVWPPESDQINSDQPERPL